MDCCQLGKSVQSVKQELSTGDPENGPPDADTTGGPPAPACHPFDHTKVPSNAKSSTSAPTDIKHLIKLNIAHPQLSPVTLEPTSLIPIKKINKRKHTIGDDDKDRYEEKIKSTIKHDTAISPTKNYINITISSLHKGLTDVTSVKDLENVMSKHLPSEPRDGKEISHGPTDFSTDTLLKQQQQKSTIQWIGTQSLKHLNRQIPVNRAMAPASALLRQLYVNRESVIRSNFMGDGKTGYSDGHSHSLPTPPGSDASGYGDQLGHKGTDIYSGYADYHSAMTPPGSVSPRDKQQYPLLYENSAYSEALRHSYLGEASLPLKPQAYSSVMGALDYAATLDQSQIFHPAPSFHFYHPQQHSPHSSLSHQSEDITVPPTMNWYPSGL